MVRRELSRSSHKAIKRQRFSLAPVLKSIQAIFNLVIVKIMRVPSFLSTSLTGATNGGLTKTHSFVFRILQIVSDLSPPTYASTNDEHTSNACSPLFVADRQSTTAPRNPSAATPISYRQSPTVLRCRITTLPSRIRDLCDSGLQEQIAELSA